MAETTRISLTFPSASDLYALRKEGDWDAAAGYERGSGESRGFLVNNGVGRPSLVDLDPAKEGPLVYDIRPGFTFPAESDIGVAASEGKFALLFTNEEKNGAMVFRCCDVPGRGPMLLSDRAIAQVEIGELPDGVSPTMEVLGADEVMKEFAELADRSELNILNDRGTILYESEIECDYDRDARLAPDFTAPALSFNIGHEIAVGDTVGSIGEGDIGEDLDEEERGYEL